jgi:hypothetical protein
MFCTNCGNNLGTDDRFCGNCGNAVRVLHTLKPDLANNNVEIGKSNYKEEVVKTTPAYQPPARPIIRKSSGNKETKTKEELRADLKKILEKKHKREITESELNESESWLTRYAEMMLGFAETQWKRDQKLKDNPKGFHLEGLGYSCHICGNSVSNEETWYDKYGIKCLICQKAVDEKIIPATAAEDKDSWYSAYDLESRFYINRHGLKRFVKEKILKPRIIPSSSGRPHFKLFLIEDNKDILPPKKLTESQLVKSQKDGQDWFHSEPWFQFADPKEVLKGYKILDYLQTLKDHEIQKSAPSLSIQFSRGASSIFEIKHANQNQSNNTSAPESPKKTENESHG